MVKFLHIKSMKMTMSMRFSIFFLKKSGILWWYRKSKLIIFLKFLSHITLRFLQPQKEFLSLFQKRHDVLVFVQDLRDMKFHIVIIMLFRLIVSTKSSFPVESKQMMRTLLKCKKIFYNTFHNMFHIALNTFREIIRSRYFSLIFLFSFSYPTPTHSLMSSLTE